jgi:uncharacterized protein (DUF1330 family)
MHRQTVRLASCALAALVLPAAVSLHAQKSAPKAYAVAEITVTNPVAYKKYLAAVTPVVKEFGGVYLVRAGKIVPLEGRAPTGRFIIIQFPSLAVAEKFESSPQYRAIAPLRLHAARSRLFLAEGAPQ